MRVVGEVGRLVADTVDDGSLVRGRAVDADHLGTGLAEGGREARPQGATRAGHDDGPSGEVAHGSPRSAVPAGSKQR